MKKQLTFCVTLLTILCTSTHAQLPSYLPADGLVAWYPFNGNANDESGNGNHGVVNGAVLAEDRNGNVNSAFNFNGVNSYIEVASQALMTEISNADELSISIWALDNISSGPPSNCMFGTWSLPSGGIYLNDYLGDGFAVAILPNGTVFNYNSAINNGVAHHFVVTYDGTQITNQNKLRVYKDGVLLNLEYPYAVPAALGPGANSLLLGARWGNPNVLQTDFWNGILDDIGIWNRALTEQEIQDLYTGTTPAACLDLPANLQDGLLGYWPFCGNANDESGNGNNGTVNGATLAADRFGNAASAYSFDGLDDQIQVISNSSVVSTNYTLSCWASLSSFYGSLFPQHYVIDAGAVGSGPFLNIDGNVTQFGCELINSVDLGLEDWNHFTVTSENNTITLYINGTLTHTNLQCQRTLNMNDVLVFGSTTINTEYFNGLLDDVIIMNRALSPEEVTQLYAVQSTGDPTAGGGGNGGAASGVPRGISYQAVARDAQGQAIVSTPINVRFTLHQGTPNGTAEYSETHALTTNEIGLFHTFFGAGTANTSAFDSIVWSNTTKFLQVEIDLGNGYVDMGTQQLMSVPYAYRANEAAAAGTIRNNTLPVYPDNAAALAGGLVAGEMYRTAAGVLMVVY